MNMMRFSGTGVSFQTYLLEDVKKENAVFDGKSTGRRRRRKGKTQLLAIEEKQLLN